MSIKDRKQARYSPNTTITVIDLIKNEPMGVLINLSLGGFMLSTEKEVPEPGSIYQVRLVDLIHQKPDLCVGAMCVWQEEANAINTYWAGFKIIDISPEMEKQLKDYLNDLSHHYSEVQ